MYDRYFSGLIKVLPFNHRFSIDLIMEILTKYSDIMNLDLDQEQWFGQMRDLAVDFGFAKKPKDYKSNPDVFLGHVGEFAEILRIATCGKASTPNFYDVLKILGKDRVIDRINYTLELLKEKRSQL